MTETEQERLERLKSENVETLRRAGQLLIVNEALAIQILREQMNAPDEKHARGGLGLALRLLAEVAKSIRTAESAREYSANKLDS